MTKTKHIFLCHANDDKTRVRVLHERLKSDGFLTWFDEEDLLPGVSWKSEINNALPNASIVVVCLSKLAISKRGFVQQEIRLALEIAQTCPEDSVYIIPAKLEPCELPRSLSQYHAVFLYENNGYQLLLKSLHTHASDAIKKPNNKFSVDLNVDGFVNSIVESLPRKISQQIQTFVIRPFIRDLLLSSSGEIPLTAEQYYESILTDITNAGENWRITEISTLSPSCWTGDINQENYFKNNSIAINRGAIIRRLFIISESHVAEYVPLATEHENSGIRIKASFSDSLNSSDSLRNILIFESPNFIKAYIGYPALDNNNRIKSGGIIYYKEKIKELVKLFDTAWSAAQTVDKLKGLNKKEQKVTHRAPGYSLTAYKLKQAVMTSRQAAYAKGIPLKNELKTLILEVSSGLVAVHVPGDQNISLRVIKKHLESVEAYFAPPETMKAIGLTQGRICAVLEPVWGMRHIYSHLLFSLEYLATSDGTKTGYFKFSPSILLEAEMYHIVDCTVLPENMF